METSSPSLVFRPQLPTASAVARYLEVLDSTRWYTNRGELIGALETRLAERLQVPKGRLAAVGSGSSALLACAIAVAGTATSDRPFCFCPGYTFVGAIRIAEMCGYTVHLIDVDRETWTVDPRLLVKHPLISRCGLVMASAPYGRRFSQAAWREFSSSTGVPVIIDAAAGIELFATDSSDLFGEIPVALSFHATKAFSTGEGGAIVCGRADVLLKAVAASNFGFMGSRQASVAGFNGKMSEYHAAVGLAELDGWHLKLAALHQVSALYSRACVRAGLKVHVWPEIASNYVLFEASDTQDAARARAALSKSRIDHRLWYGLGIHKEPYFWEVSRDPMSEVEDLAPRLIGLPVAHDLDEDSIEAIVGVLARA